MFPTVEEIKEVVDFFSNRKDLPKELQVARHWKINDMEKFAQSHISTIRFAYKNKKVNFFYAYYNRLVEVKELLTDNKILLGDENTKH